MKKIVVFLIICFLMLGCSNNKLQGKNNYDIGSVIDTIIDNGPVMSSNPYDYINESMDQYESLLRDKMDTFKYAIKDLIDSNAGNGLKSYIEAVLCSEINDSFKYEFESAIDYLEHYKNFLLDAKSKLSEYDKYAKSLLEQ